MRRIADTSFLYTVFDASDSRNVQARDEISKPQTVEIPLAVLSEFIGLFEYRHGLETAKRVHADLLGLATVAIVGIKDEARVVDIWLEHPELSIFDAAGVVACLETKARLLSYDVRQARVLAAIRAKRGALASTS